LSLYQRKYDVGDVETAGLNIYYIKFVLQSAKSLSVG